MKNCFRKLAAIALLALLAASSHAQEESGIIQLLKRVDKILEEMQNDNDMDSSYVAVPEQKLAIRVSSDISQGWIASRGIVDEDPVYMALKSTTRYKERINVGYRNLSVGIGFDPRFMLKKGVILGLNSYGNKFGYKVEYLHKTPFHGDLSYNSEIIDEEIDAMYSSFSVDLYYVLDRRFSMNAVYGLSYTQTRSAGSLFLTAAGITDKTQLTELDGIGVDKITSSGIYFGLGLGYGYNLVMPHDWVLHVSLLPNILFVDRSKVSIETNSHSDSGYVPNFCADVNIGLNHQMGKWFAGMLCTFEEQRTGRSRYASTDYMTFRGKISLGRRF